MDNQLSEEKRRVSYAEWKEVFALVLQQAKSRRLTPTDILREATQLYFDITDWSEAQVVKYWKARKAGDERLKKRRK